MVKKAVASVFFAVSVFAFSQASDQVSSARRPNDIAVVVDVSGSMREGGIMDAVKEYLDREIVKSLVRVGDRFTLIAFGSEARIVLEKTVSSESDIAALSSGIRSLKAAEGYTDLGTALEVFDSTVSSRMDGSYRPVAVFITDGKNAPPPSSKYSGKNLALDERFLDAGKRIAMKGWRLYVMGLGAETDAPAVASAVSGSVLAAQASGDGTGGSPGTGSGSSSQGSSGGGSGSVVSAALNPEALGSYLAETSEETAARVSASEPSSDSSAAGKADADDRGPVSGAGLLIAIVVFAAAACAGGIFLVLRTRRRKDEDQEQRKG